MIVQGRRLATRPWCPLPKEVATKAQVQGNGGQGHTPQPKTVAAKVQVPGKGGHGHTPQPKEVAAKAQVPGKGGQGPATTSCTGDDNDDAEQVGCSDGAMEEGGLTAMVPSPCCGNNDQLSRRRQRRRGVGRPQ